MTGDCVLALDQGTTSTKAVLVRSDGSTIAEASVPVQRSYPRSGWVEQDALELWESVPTAVELVLENANGVPACIAITNQRESVVVWDRKTGRPLGPVVSWQCRRGEGFVDELRALGAEGLVRDVTGLPLDGAFAAPKLRWLLDSDPRVRAAAECGEARAGTVDSWILWNLTGGAVHATDPGNASRTLLFDIHTLAWNDELLELFGVPRACLPEVVTSAGVVTGEAASLRRLPDTPVAGLAADSHAALLGHGCLRQGSAKVTFATGASMMTPTGGVVPSSRHGLVSTVAWTNPEPTYALEGNILSSGSTVQWLSELLSVEGGATGVERLGATVGDSGGVHIVPGFAGLGAPHWDATARGRIEGLTFASGPAQLARAAIESSAYQVADLVEAADLDLAAPLAELRVDGGGSRNHDLLQFQADILGRPVLKSECPDAAAVGVAYLGGLAVGMWADEDAIEALPRAFQHFEPRFDEERRQELLAGWRAAVNRRVALTEEWTR